MKRICGIFLAFTLLLALVPMINVATPVAAAEKETILIAGSDFQVSNHNTSRIQQILLTLAVHGITKADGAFFCGDYTLNSVDENGGQSSYGLATLKNLFTPIVGDKMTFVQGNHDPEDTVGLSKSGNNDPVSQKYGAYVIHEDQYLQYNWDHSLGVAEKTAADLKKYLDEKANSGWNKPIFILSHVGLHWGNRTIKEGSAIHGGLLVDVLNEAGKKGLNIIFLYGHDHSGGVADFMGGAAIYLKKGDTMEVCTGQKKEHEPRTINFTYMNAGYIGYYSTDEASCDATVTMSVFRIKGNEVIITRYDGNIDLDKKQYGIHNLKSAGIWHPSFSQEGYHAVPDTRVYASSRKVTATADVAVATPMPEELANPTQTTTTTTTVAGGVVVHKTTASKVNPVTTEGTKIPEIAATTTTGAKQTATVSSSPLTTTTKGEGVASDGAAGNPSTTVQTSGSQLEQPTEGIDQSGSLVSTTMATVSTDGLQEMQPTGPEGTVTESGTTDVLMKKQEHEHTDLWLIVGIVAGILLLGGGAAALIVLKKKQD